jgi:hypothetical protein
LAKSSATTPAVPELVKVKELSVTDIANHRILARFGFSSFAAGLCAVALLLGPGLRASSAEEAGTTSVNAKSEDPTASPAPKARYGGRYFVDFRSRTAASYGHAFLWYGRLKDNGKVGAIEVAGLHPASDSVVPYILGHIIPVPSETGKSYGDLDEQYLTASYRVYLTDVQARAVFAYIKQKQASSPVWQAGTVNCTGFISDVASFMGLRTPPFPTLMYPEDLVNAIKKLNGGRQEVAAFATASH